MKSAFRFQICHIIVDWTYPLGHIVIGSSVHVSGGPLEEALLGDGSSLPMSGVVELVLSFSKVGVIKVGPSLALAHFYFNIDINSIYSNIRQIK